MSHFQNEPRRDGLIYLFVVLGAFSYAVLAIVAPFIVPKCNDNLKKEYPNPEFDYNSCLDERYLVLLWMSLRDCEQFRQLMFSVFMGALIGYERRSPDRAAGIRTMSVTSLGSCAFTIASMYAFRGGPMAWDASRVSAAIPSGVGFLGSGLIWKGMVGEGTDQLHQVHGLTTAASIWLSAAIGVVCGGGMYLVAFFSVVCAVIMLRFGPRSHSEENGTNMEDYDQQARRSYSSASLAGSPQLESSRSDPTVELTEDLRSRLLTSSSALLDLERRAALKRARHSVLNTHY